MTSPGLCPSCGYILRVVKLVGSILFVCDRCREKTGSIFKQDAGYVPENVAIGEAVDLADLPLTTTVFDLGPPGPTATHFAALCDHSCGAQSRVELPIHPGDHPAALRARAERELERLVLLHQRRHGCVS